MELHGRSLIGSGTGATGGAVFRGFDPVKGKILEPDFHSVTPQELERAVQLAASAAPVWAELSGGDRNRFLRCVADKLEQNVTPLAERASQETGLPMARCTGEIARTA